MTRFVKALAKVLAITFGAILVLVGSYVCYHSEWVIDIRRSLIRAEADRLGNVHPWAGTYYRGDHLGTNELLSLAPRQGYQYANHGCLGLYDWDHGSVEQIDSCLRLDSRSRFDPVHPCREFTIVNWGPRRYLVEPKDMLLFVNSANTSPNGDLFSWPFYLRVEDSERRVTGIPVLPDKFAHLLLASPLEGHVLSVGDVHSSTLESRPERESELDVDRGRADGAFEGMRLQCSGDSYWGFLTLKDVGENSSRAILKQASRDPVPQVGWLVYSSRAP